MENWLLRYAIAYRRSIKMATILGGFVAAVLMVGLGVLFLTLRYLITGKE
jgi:hypothetical protein